MSGQMLLHSFGPFYPAHSNGHMVEKIASAIEKEMKKKENKTFCKMQ